MVRDMKNHVPIDRWLGTESAESSFRYENYISWNIVVHGLLEAPAVVGGLQFSSGLCCLCSYFVVLIEVESCVTGVYV
jgi:hypothetical protein